MKNLLQPLAKNVLTPLGLTAVKSAADAGIHKKILGSRKTTVIIQNEEMEDKIILKPDKDYGLSLKGNNKTIQNEVKNKRDHFLVCY